MNDNNDDGISQVLISKAEWLLKYKPETADEAFNMLYEQFNEQTETMLELTASMISRPPMKKITKWYEFWNPQSGFIGGIIMGVVLLIIMWFISHK
jgi:hypothetical protein